MHIPATVSPVSHARLKSQTVVKKSPVIGVKIWHYRLPHRVSVFRNIIIIPTIHGVLQEMTLNLMNQIPRRFLIIWGMAATSQDRPF